MTQSKTESRAVGAGSSGAILPVLFVGVLMGALDIAIVGPVLPTLQKTFGVDERATAWVFTIYVLLNLIGTPFMAKLSDRFGRRSIYVMDVLIFAGGSLLVALAPSFELLLVGRALQGFGAGGIFPVASAVIGDTFPPEKRGSALGLIGAVFGMAFLIGPVLAAIFLGIGWRWLFIINLPIAAIVAVLAMRVLPQTRAAQPKAFDATGMIVLAALLSSLAWGINGLDSSRFGASLVSLGVWPFLLAALVLGFVFAGIERRAQDPIVSPSLFRSRQVALASTFAAGAGLGEASLAFLPALAVAGLGLSSQASSFTLMPVVLAMAFGAPIAGRLLDRIGSKPVVLAGLVLIALGAGSFELMGSSLVMFIVAGVLVGLGLASLLGAPLRYIILNEASAEERGAAQGLLSTFTTVGQLVSGALIGAIAASSGGGAAGYETAFLAIGLVALVMVFLAFGLKARSQERPGDAPTSGTPSMNH